MGSIKTVLVSDVRENEIGIKEMDNSRLDDLKKSIQEIGLMRPILVREQTDWDQKDYYQIIDGHHRHQVYKILGLETIHIHITDMSDSKVLEYQIMSSFHKTEVTKQDYSYHLRRLLASNLKLTLPDLSLRMGCEESFIVEHLYLNGLSNSNMKKVEAGLMTLMKGYILAKLPKHNQLVYQGIEDVTFLIPQVHKWQRENKYISQEHKEYPPEVEPAVQCHVCICRHCETEY